MRVGMSCENWGFARWDVRRFKRVENIVASMTTNMESNMRGFKDEEVLLLCPGLGMRINWGVCCFVGILNTQSAVNSLLNPTLDSPRCADMNFEMRARHNDGARNSGDRRQK